MRRFVSKERLDGKGYWRGLTSEQLDLDMRCITAADVFDALTASRPYREAMSLDQAFRIMAERVGTSIDADCLAVLKSRYQLGLEIAA